MSIIYVSQKSKWSKKNKVKPYSKPKKVPPRQQGILKLAKAFTRISDPIPSRESTGYAAGAKKEDKIYTGDNVIGVATMHKSNAVPIFNDEEAKDVASMRRN